MSRGLIVELADCSKFRQTVAARPPRIVHGAAILLLGLLAVAILWATIVKANLVVRATGRVRSVEVPTRVFAPAFSDMVGRVVEAPFDEGDVVHAGDMLVRLDTEQIDNRIAKLQRTLATVEEELRMLAGLETLLVEQLSAAKEKAMAELKQAEACSPGLKINDPRRFEVRKLGHAARDVVKRLQRLRSSGVATEEEMVKAATALREAEEILVTAELPVDQERVQVGRKGVDLVNRDFAVRRAEAEARRVAKEGEVAAVHRDVRQLELRRAESVLRSPIDGVVVTGRVKPGDVLEPGKPVMEIALCDSYCFEVAIVSEDVGQVQLGMPVCIKFDAYNYQRYGVMTGTVTYLSPDSRMPRENEAGPAAATMSPGNRNSPAQFLVRIRMDADAVGRDQMRGAIKLGLGGTAEIVTDRESLLMIFFRRIRQSISLGKAVKFSADSPVK